MNENRRMRQGQNKRSRGRSSGRKNSNPLTRHYDSNGPDVKVRGIASHVAERYVQLARDAASSGDSVMAENYFQHAEHYNRIISSAQASQNGRVRESQPRVGTTTLEDQDVEPLSRSLEASVEPENMQQPSSDGLAAVPDNVELEEFEQGEKPKSQSENSGRAARNTRARTRRRNAPKDLAASSDPADSPQPSILNDVSTSNGSDDATADNIDSSADPEANAQAQ